MERDYKISLLVHTVILFFATLLISFSLDSVIFETTYGDSGRFLFLFFAGLSIIQLLVSVLGKTVPEMGMGLIFLSDIVVIWVLARASGGSSSPFLFIFPLTALLGTMIFRRSLGITIFSASAFFQFISIGFVPAAFSNAFATLLISGLGMYLVRALTTSDKALKVSEVARRRLENLQKAILANIPSGLMSIDSEGRIIQINSVGLKILNLEEQNIIFKSLSQLWPSLADTTQKFKTTPSEVLAGFNKGKIEGKSGDRPLVEYQNPFTKESSKLGYSIVKLSEPDSGSELGTLVVFQDLTEIMKLEENLRVSEKLAAIGKLAAGIAHEIRNPLAGISGSAQLLSELKNLSDEDEKLLNIIQKESSRLDSLITDFLDYVRPPQTKHERVKIYPIAKHVVESLEVNPKWIELNCSLEIKTMGTMASELLIEGDANRITQVLINLILNAGQAGAKQVQIQIDQISRSLKIVDDGAGISRENQKRLFEPFFTTKEKGTGLGLATSYRVLESMGARISVESPLPNFSPQGGGTQFTIVFKEAA